MITRIQQPYRGMPRRVSPEQPAVGGDERAAVFESEREINGVPKRYLIVEGKIHRGSKQWTRLEQAQLGCLHQAKGPISLGSRHLRTPNALRDQAGEFEQEKIRGDQYNLTR